MQQISKENQYPKTNSTQTPEGGKSEQLTTAILSQSFNLEFVNMKVSRNGAHAGWPLPSSPFDPDACISHKSMSNFK